MKAKILSLVIIATVAFAIGWNLNQSEAPLSLTELSLSNVEALAEVEGDGDGGLIVSCGRYEGYCWEIKDIGHYFPTVDCRRTSNPWSVCYFL